LIGINSNLRGCEWNLPKKKKPTHDVLLIEKEKIKGKKKGKCN